MSGARNRQMVTARPRDAIMANAYPLLEWVEDRAPRLIESRPATEVEWLVGTISQMEVRACPSDAAEWPMDAAGRRYPYAARTGVAAPWVGGTSVAAAQRRTLATLARHLGLSSRRLDKIATKHRLYTRGLRIPHPDSRTTRRRHGESCFGRDWVESDSFGIVQRPRQDSNLQPPA